MALSVLALLMITPCKSVAKSNHITCTGTLIDLDLKAPAEWPLAVLLAFYDFPAEHWKHLRTSNPIESTFVAVRHRTVGSKGCLSN